MKRLSTTMKGTLGAAFLASMALPASAAEARPYAEVVMNADTHEVVSKKERCKSRYKTGDCIVYPASMTKMVSAAIVLQEIEKGNINFDDSIRVSRNAAAFSRKGSSGLKGIRAGYRITVRDALGMMAKKSDNTFTTALAEHTAGSVSNFVRMMNSYTKELGVENTTFVNPTGMPDSRQRTSAVEMAKLYSILSQNEKIREFFDGKAIVYKNAMYRPDAVVCYNRLQPIAMKTGYTNMSGSTIGFVYQASNGTKYTITLFGFSKVGNTNGSVRRNARLVEIINGLDPVASDKRANMGPGYCARQGKPVS